MNQFCFVETINRFGKSVVIRITDRSHGLGRIPASAKAVEYFNDTY